MDPATVPVASRDRGPKAATAGCSTSSFDAILISNSLPSHYSMQCVHSWHIKIVMRQSSSFLSSSSGSQRHTLIATLCSNIFSLWEYRPDLQSQEPRPQQMQSCWRVFETPSRLCIELTQDPVRDWLLDLLPHCTHPF